MTKNKRKRLERKTLLTSTSKMTSYEYYYIPFPTLYNYTDDNNEFKYEWVKKGD